MEFRLVVILIFLAASVSASSHLVYNLPNSIQICKRNSLTRDTCLKFAVQRVFSSLSHGIPELNVPTLDPSNIDKIKLEYRDGNDVYGTLNLKSLKTYGYSQIQVKQIQTKLTDKKLILEMETFLPVYVMEGRYKSNGKLYDLNINARGYFNTTMTDVVTKWKLIGKLEERNGEEYMKIHKFEMEPIPKDLEIHADGLFSDPDLNRIALVAINEFFKVSYKSLLPAAQNYWSQVSIDLANKFFNVIPFGVLMPLH